MCWFTYNDPVREIAEHDIYVYKILKKCDDGKILSPVVNKLEWELHKTACCNEPIPKYIEFDSPAWIIESGLHSLSKKPYVEIIEIIVNDTIISTQKLWMTKTCSRTIFKKDKNECVYECIIPAGSVYYENEHGEIVSDGLELIKEVHFKQHRLKIRIS